MDTIRLPSGEEIKNLRLKAKLTQKRLAEMAGVTQAYIAKIENNQADPKLSTLQRIIEVIEREISAPPPTTVERIASTPVISLKPSDSIKKAVKLMEKCNISQVPIILSGRQVGSLTETTLLKRVASGEKLQNLLKQEVSKIMEEPFPVVTLGTDVRTVYPLLEQHPAVLVTNMEKITGIITKADIFKLPEKIR